MQFKILLEFLQGRNQTTECGIKREKLNDKRFEHFTYHPTY